jgi:hypothetical protein
MITRDQAMQIAQRDLGTDDVQVVDFEGGWAVVGYKGTDVPSHDPALVVGGGPGPLGEIGAPCVIVDATDGTVTRYGSIHPEDAIARYSSAPER